ncbi:hypothetical protein GGF46_002874, partial [Coemansia sp. RSA 552]
QSSFSTGSELLTLSQRCRRRLKMALDRRPAMSRVWSAMERAAAFMIVVLGTGQCLAYGLFQPAYESRFAETDSKRGHVGGAALVGALQVSSFIATQGVVPAVNRRLGIGGSMVLGAAANGGGLLAGGYSSQLWHLWLAQGMVAGAGSAMGAASALQMWMPGSRARVRVAGAGIGGGALALLVCALMAATGSAARALRWLALVVCGGQLMSVAILATCWHCTHRPPRSSGCARSQGKKGLDATDQAPAASADLRITTSAVATGGQTSDLDRRQRRRARIHRTCSLVSGTCHHLAFMLPPMFIPGYARQQLAAVHSLSAAALVAILCFMSAVGTSFARLLIGESQLSPWVLLVFMRLLLSLTVWCLWLPAASSWATVVAFCIAYGMILGTVGYIDCFIGVGSRKLDLQANASAALVGIAMAGLLLATAKSATSIYLPLITFTGSASMVSALATGIAAATTPICAKYRPKRWRPPPIEPPAFRQQVLMINRNQQTAA